MKSRILLVVFFAAVLFAHLTQITDPDLFWHLASGRWIWEHRQLPHFDPFNYTTSVKAYEDSFMARIIPRQYWLADIAQYGTYNLAGYGGILGLRLLFAFLTLLMVFLHLRKKRLSIITSLPLLLPLAYILIQFKGDRPNQMTFFFLAAFLYLIENIRTRYRIQDTGSKMQDTVSNQSSCTMNHASSFSQDRGSWIVHHASLPLLMLFWANMHGGFIVGTAIACIYIFSELMRTLFDRTHAINKHLIVIPAVTIFAGLLNPNGYNVIYGIIREASPLQNSEIYELMTPFALINFGAYRYFIAAVSWLLAATISIIVIIIVEYRDQKSRARSRESEFRIQNPESRIQEPEFKSREPEVATEARCQLPAARYTLPAARYTLHAARYTLRTVLLSHSEEILITLFFGLIAFEGVRYIPLFAIAVTPVIGRCLSGKVNSLLKRLSGFMIPEAAILCVLAYGVWAVYPATALKKPLLSDIFPDAAVNFIREKNIKTEGLFNHYDWGGYLIWRFYPDKVVFIDGRNLSLGVYNQYNSVMIGEKEPIMGVPTYKAILDAYAVRNILIPGVDRVGGLTPLISTLVDDPEWRLIFFSKNCLLFTRKESEPDFPKVVSYAVAMEAAFTFLGSDNPRPYLTVARANVGLGRKDTAVAFLKDALKKKPSLKGGPVEKALELINNGKDILQENTGLP